LDVSFDIAFFLELFCCFSKRLRYGVKSQREGFPFIFTMLSTGPLGYSSLISGMLIKHPKI